MFSCDHLEQPVLYSGGCYAPCFIFVRRWLFDENLWWRYLWIEYNNLPLGIVKSTARAISGERNSSGDKHVCAGGG